MRLLGERRLNGYAHGPLIFELSALVELIRYLALRVLGSVQSPEDFLVSAIADPFSRFRILHVLSACAGLGCLAAIYRLGLIFGGPLVGALSALFCSTNLTFIIMTTIYKEDPFYWVLLFFSMERSWAAAQGPDRRAAAQCGAAVGAALSAKYMAMCGLPLLGLPLMRAGLAGLTSALRQVSLGAACAAAAFLSLFPFLLTDTVEVMKSIIQLGEGTGGIMPHPPLAVWAYLSHHLPNMAGVAVPVLGVIELGRRLQTEPRGPVLLAVVPIGLLLLMGLRRSISYAYYVFPAAAFLWILASSLAVHVSRNFSGWRKGFPLMLCVLPLVDGAFLPGAAKYALLVTGPDTRALAQNYLEAHAADGDCVAVNLGTAGENLFGPQLAPNALPPGHGPFTRARAKAFARGKGKKFALRIIEDEPGWTAESGRIPAAASKGCDWVVLGRRGRISNVEYGLDKKNGEVRTEAPPGFRLAATVEAYPPPHSKSYSLFSSLDYAELSSVSFPALWKNRAMGLSFDIYRAHARGDPR